jgi:hypothetical protein
MEDGHAAPGQGWIMVNEFLPYGINLAFETGQMVLDLPFNVIRVM